MHFLPNDYTVEPAPPSNSERPSDVIEHYVSACSCWRIYRNVHGGPGAYRLSADGDGFDLLAVERDATKTDAFPRKNARYHVFHDFEKVTHRGSQDIYEMIRQADRMYPPMSIEEVDDVN